jgi:hypothetical protein
MRHGVFVEMIVMHANGDVGVEVGFCRRHKLNESNINERNSKPEHGYKCVS